MQERAPLTRLEPSCAENSSEQPQSVRKDARWADYVALHMKRQDGVRVLDTETLFGPPAPLWLGQGISEFIRR